MYTLSCLWAEDKMEHKRQGGSCFEEIKGQRSKVNRCQSGGQIVSSLIGQPPQEEGKEGGKVQKVTKTGVTVGSKKSPEFLDVQQLLEDSFPLPH